MFITKNGPTSTPKTSFATSSIWVGDPSPSSRQRGFICVWAEKPVEGKSAVIFAFDGFLLASRQKWQHSGAMVSEAVLGALMTSTIGFTSAGLKQCMSQSRFSVNAGDA